jgi:hypothetical protein
LFAKTTLILYFRRPEIAGDMVPSPPPGCAEHSAQRTILCSGSCENDIGPSLVSELQLMIREA